MNTANAFESVNFGHEYVSPMMEIITLTAEASLATSGGNTETVIEDINEFPWG